MNQQEEKMKAVRVRHRFAVKTAWAAAALLFGAGMASAIAVPAINTSQGILTVGAGSMSYVGKESPGTGLSLDARYDLNILPGIALEGSGTTAFSKSVNGDGTTIPVILEGGLKLQSQQSGNVGLFGVAGVGYGAYMGTEHLQDGATFTVPLAVGATWQGAHYGLAPRFTYRPVFGDELGSKSTRADADSWTAVLDVQIPYL
jgi:hypothetical protein